MRTKVISYGNEIIGIDEMKNFIKQDDPNLPSLENSLILNLIKAARESIEKEAGISLIDKVLELQVTEDDLDDGVILLPYPPVKSVTKVEREDNKGVRTTLTLNTDYYVTGSDHKEVKILSNYYTLDDSKLKYYITYRVGYSDNYDAIINEPVTGTFTNSNLVNGILTIRHEKGTQNILLELKDENGYSEIIKYKLMDNDTVIVDYGGDITGTHSYILYYWSNGESTTVSSENIPSDLRNGIMMQVLEWYERGDTSNPVLGVKIRSIINRYSQVSSIG